MLLIFESDPFEKIKNTTLKNPDRLIIAQLNIESLCKEFDSLVKMLHNNLDMLLIFESDPFEKIKNTTLKNPDRLIIAQLNIEPLRNEFDSLIQMLHNNLDMLLFYRDKLFLLVCTYNPNKYLISNLNLKEIGKNLDNYSK